MTEQGGRPGAEASMALDRALRLLDALTETPGGLTVTALAERLGTSRPAVYRLLATLIEHGYARRSADGRVRLGLSLLQLSQAVLPALRAAAAGPLRRLADDTGATAHLTVADGETALAVAVVEPSWTDFHVGYRVGARHPLDRGAAGQAILAGRRNGSVGAVATSGQLQEGAHGVAAPVLGFERIEASVGVVALAPLGMAEIGPRVIIAASEVARALR